MKRWIMALLAIGVWPATADETIREIYESSEDVQIGRVFLTPEERARLDAVRHLAPTQTEAGTDTTAPAETDPPDGSGYIKVSGKAPRVFRDGDFVRTTGAEQLEFRTDGVVVRHGERREEPHE